MDAPVSNHKGDRRDLALLHEDLPVFRKEPTIGARYPGVSQALIREEVRRLVNSGEKLVVRSVAKAAERVGAGAVDGRRDLVVCK